jgi:NADH/NAD ratio-sensing transcriptional regulator Rex
MARSDSFFIRANVQTNGAGGASFVQSSIDLGAFVDALGKTVMRIHNASISYGSPLNGISNVPLSAVGTTAFQLTTQSQTGMIGAINRSSISTGTLTVAGNAAQDVTSMSEALDIAPQEWTGGYLVAVEQIFLGVQQQVVDLVDEVTIVLECTVETMTAAASMALALSQQ